MNDFKVKSQEFWDFLFENGSNDISIYIHIPFCEQKCLYCDFYSCASDKTTHEKYIDSLLFEISEYKEYLKNKTVKSIFIGGGTPSAIDSKLIAKLMNYLSNICKFSSDCEITIESNPNSLTDENIKTYLNSGINRFSVGAQSINDNILKTIGRIHNKNQISNAVELLKKNGVKNFNLDFMLALPSQTLSDVEESITFIKEHEIAHVSYYSLILEEETPLYNKKAILNFPNEDEDREMYSLVVSELEKIGIKQYEISNFAKAGFECKHNLRYWKLKDYLGFGCSAQSNVSHLRFSNTSGLKSYISKDFQYEVDWLNSIQRANEYNMLNLRLNSGIDIAEFNKLFNMNFEKVYRDEINNNSKNGLISVKNGKIILTKLGKDLSNIVELDFTMSVRN